MILKSKQILINTDSTKGKGGYLGWVEYENSGMVEDLMQHLRS